MIYRPLKLVNSKQAGERFVLDKKGMRQIKKIKSYLKNSLTGDAAGSLKKNGKAGCSVLFLGPESEGKMATAALLGKEFNRPVYKIDLSSVVSKYIGETEKNIDQLFARAEGKNWILFFDEADALFGKRTDVKDAHDRYANQETAYLLQQLEQFNGLTILATNLKGNIDSAFLRRFQSAIYFENTQI